MSTVIYQDHNGLTVHADDSETGRGHNYSVTPPNSEGVIAEVNFQNGTVLDMGVNGVTNEALLAIVIHRTEVLNGKFPCTENEQAISAMKGALAAFESRTANRQSRGVEGKHVK